MGCYIVGVGGTQAPVIVPSERVVRRHMSPVGQGVAAFVQFTGMQYPFMKRRMFVADNDTDCWHT